MNLQKSHWMTLATLFLLSSSPAISQAQSTNPAPAYDEIYDRNGQVRPHYQRFMQTYKTLNRNKVKAFRKKSLEDFKGDNAVSPLPRVISRNEYEVLKKGVVQRGLAIQAFVQDHYSGKKSYLGGNVIPEQVLHGILARNNELVSAPWMGREPISFFYGPDVIRDSQGAFRVVEDNTGYIGGRGDLLVAKSSLLNQFPEYGSAITPGHDPEKWYEILATRYKDLASKDGGISIIVSYTTATSSDNEDERLRTLFRKHGVEQITVNVDGQVQGTSRLFVRDGHVYFTKNSRTPAQVVKNVILGIDPTSFDVTHPIIRDGYWKSRAEGLLERKRDRLTPEFKKRLIELMEMPEGAGLPLSGLIENGDENRPYKRTFGVTGFWDAVEAGNVKVINTPGMEFVNDKEFYVYVENMIRFYLKQEPIIRNIETDSFASFDGSGNPRMRQELLEKFKQSPADYVIKKTIGRGGSAVYIGAKMNPAEFPALYEMIEKSPVEYIMQKFTALSEMDGQIVDLRLYADFFGKEAVVAPVPWGRATSLDGDGKVNLSAKGHETTVFVVDPAHYCRENLGPASSGTSH